MKNAEIQSILNKIFTGVVIIIGISILNTVLIYSNRDSNNNNPVGNNNNNNVEQTGDTYDVSKFTEITASEIKSKTKDKTSVVYVGRSSCSWCVKFVPILSEATTKYNLNTLYVDIAKIIDFSAGGIKDQTSYDVITKLETVSGFENYMSENFGSTPMTLIVRDGKILDAQTGYVESDGLKTFLQKNGLVN